MTALLCHQFPCLSDNYGVLVHDPHTGATASIDAPDANAVKAALAEMGWSLTDIFVTHHHADHTGGIDALKSDGVTVTGPAAEAAKIKGLDRSVSEGDTVRLGDHEAEILETPGHTLGHIAYWFKADNLAFAGDTLFALGCGRVFEGTPPMMWDSLKKLRAMPDATVVYCGHEYTLSNARFALTVDPGNAALKSRAAAIEAMRDRGEPTLPTTIGAERATNPFLRPDDPGIRAAVKMPGADDAAVFAEIRALKDRF